MQEEELKNATAAIYAAHPWENPITLSELIVLLNGAYLFEIG